MGHRVLGIAVGEETVRVAVVETRLRRFELKAALEAPRRAPAPRWEEGEEPPELPSAEGPAPEGTGDLVRRLLQPPPQPVDTVALAYPGDRAFVRRLSLPFRKVAQVEAALPFQMIGQVPVAPEDIHTAWERVPAEGTGTEALAVAVPAGEFRAFLDAARAQGLDPAHVGVDGPCLASLLPWCEAPLAEDGLPSAQMLVWAEDDDVEVVVARGAQAVLTRAVRLGEPVTSRGEVAASFLREAVLSVAAAAEGGASVARVLVAGPDAFVLAGPLGEALGLPCQVLDPAALPIPGAASCPGLSPSMVKALALALGAAAGGGPGSLNLRGGPFATEGARGILRERTGYIALALALFLVLGAGKAVARWVGLQGEKDALVAEMKAFTKDVFGAEKESFDAALKQMKSISEEDVKVFPKWTAPATLLRITKAMMEVGHAKGAEAPAAAEGDGESAPPASAEGAWAMELESVRVEPRQATLKGEAESIETLDAFVARLKSDPCFQEVVSESTERIQFQRHQGWQRFTLRLTVDCNPREAPRKAAAAAPAAGTGKEKAAPAK